MFQKNVRPTISHCEKLSQRRFWSFPSGGAYQSPHRAKGSWGLGCKHEPSWPNPNSFRGETVLTGLRISAWLENNTQLLFLIGGSNHVLLHFSSNDEAHLRKWHRAPDTKSKAKQKALPSSPSTGFSANSCLFYQFNHRPLGSISCSIL